MQARAKHDAWVAQAQKYADDEEGAKARYIEIAKDLGWEGGKSGSGGAMGGVRVSMMAQDEGEGSGSTSKLHEAVLDGQIKEVERLLSAGAGVDSRDAYVSFCLSGSRLPMYAEVSGPNTAASRGR
jgi:hypothetical protein